MHLKFHNICLNAIPMFVVIVFLSFAFSLCICSGKTKLTTVLKIKNHPLQFDFKNICSLRKHSVHQAVISFKRDLWLKGLKRVLFSLLNKNRVKSPRNKCIRKACWWYHRCDICPLGAVEVFVRVLLWNLIEICYLEEPQRKHKKAFNSMWVISTCVPLLLLSREELSVLTATMMLF